MVLFVPLLASVFAVGAAWALTSGKRAVIKSHGVWYQTLREERPRSEGEEFSVWLHLKLKDETEYWGVMRSYTEDDSNPVREIVLGGESLFWQPKSATSPQEIGAGWDAVVVNAEEIMFIRLAYQDEEGNLLGRTTPNDPRGRPLSPLPGGDTD